jgi:hypothetical protein
MIFNHPGRLMVIAICMLIFGVVMPFLMVLHVVASTFFLNFLSFLASTLGFFLGMISFSSYRVKSKHDKDKSGDDRFGS